MCSVLWGQVGPGNVNAETIVALEPHVTWAGESLTSIVGNFVIISRVAFVLENRPPKGTFFDFFRE